MPAGERWNGPHDAGDAVEIDGLPLRGAFDLVTALERFLAEDCADFRAAPRPACPRAASCSAIRPTSSCSARRSSRASSSTCARGRSCSSAGVEVRHGTRLEGPLYAGPGTKLLGGFIRGSVFGPECRVHGEISASVFLGYANKSHDGFVGHSVVGHWVNLGALTTTSNLKNTYGPVRLEIAGQRIETGRQNLGTLFGDHAKTAIGTMLATGTVVVGRRQRVRPAHAAQVRAAVRVGRRRATSGSPRTDSSAWPSGSCRAAGGADAGAAPVARADVRAAAPRG